MFFLIQNVAFLSKDKNIISKVGILPGQPLLRVTLQEEQIIRVLLWYRWGFRTYVTKQRHLGKNSKVSSCCCYIILKMKNDLVQLHTIKYNYSPREQLSRTGAIFFCLSSPKLWKIFKKRLYNKWQTSFLLDSQLSVIRKCHRFYSLIISVECQSLIAHVSMQIE